MIGKSVHAALAGLALLYLAPAWPQADAPTGAPPVPAPKSVPDVPIRPGPELPARAGARLSNPYEGDKQAIKDGQRLYEWYNCAGCHAPKGGGGMGPPLSDDDWIYGDDPASIFSSIWEGRPEGMPTFAGRIPKNEVWKIITYLKTLPGDTPAFAPQDKK